MSKAKLMLGNAVEISLIFRLILGPLVLGWVPNHFVSGIQLALCEKRLVSLHQQLKGISMATGHSLKSYRDDWL